MCEISLSFLNQIMKGTNAPSLEVFHRIVEKLKITPESLMFGDSRPVQPKPLDPADFTSAAMIAAALTDMNNKIGKMALNLSPSAAAVASKLAALNESQLNLVSGFIDDIVELEASDSDSSGVG